MTITQALQSLGFSEREATVYLALLRLGEAPAGELIKQTGLHRELVYGALERLGKLGYVRTVEKRKIRHFIAEDPELLVKRARQKAVLATKLGLKLKSIYRKQPVTVRIYEGAAGYEEIQRDIQISLKDGATYFVIGASGGAWYDITQKFYKRYRKQCLQRNIHAKMVTYANEVKNLLENEVSGFAEIRVLPQLYAVPSSTKIYDDRVILQIFSDPPVAIMVQSKEVAAAYRHYFQTLWEIAKPVK